METLTSATLGARTPGLQALTSDFQVAVHVEAAITAFKYIKMVDSSMQSADRK